MARLAAIHRRAGAAATVADDLLAAAGEVGMSAEVVVQAVLSRGAWRTISTNVRIWERVEAWAQARGHRPYPPSLALVTAFCASCAQAQCGPSVVPSIRGAVGWICRRLGMPAPNVDSEPLLAIQAQVFEERGKDLKEARPIPVDGIILLEAACAQWLAEGKKNRAIRSWLILCMVWGSMRFDDALHVVPSRAEASDFALMLFGWQTKVERKRRGTRYAVCNLSVFGVEWLVPGFALWQATAPAEYMHGDFWLPGDDGNKLLWDRPAEYGSFAAALRTTLKEACRLNRAKLDRFKVAQVAAEVEAVTPHSLKVTIVDAMAHHGAPDRVLMLQGNWQDGRMPAKYLRDRKSVPLSYVPALANDMKKGWRPAAGFPAPPTPPAPLAAPAAAALPAAAPEPVVEPGLPDPRSEDEGEDDDEGDNDDLHVCFWESLKADEPDRDLRFHVAAAQDPQRLACGRLQVAECRPLGIAWPERGAFCGRCRDIRPDVVAARAAQAAAE